MESNVLPTQTYLFKTLHEGMEMDWFAKWNGKRKINGQIIRRKMIDKRMYLHKSVWFWLKPSLCMWLRFWCELNEKNIQFYTWTTPHQDTTHTYTAHEKQMEWMRDYERISNNHWKVTTTSASNQRIDTIYAYACMRQFNDREWEIKQETWYKEKQQPAAQCRIQLNSGGWTEMEKKKMHTRQETKTERNNEGKKLKKKT